MLGDKAIASINTFGWTFSICQTRSLSSQDPYQNPLRLLLLGARGLPPLLVLPSVRARPTNVTLAASPHFLTLSPHANLIAEHGRRNGDDAGHLSSLSCDSTRYALPLEGAFFPGLGLLCRKFWLWSARAHRKMPHFFISALTIIQTTCRPPSV